MNQIRLSQIELPRKVIIGECWARDGLQNEKKIIPTEQKVYMINKFQELGFKKIEVTNFAHPKYLPQFADALEVLKRIDRKPGVDFRAIVTNMRGLERAIEAKEMGYPVQELAFVISASEAHNKANVNMSHKENMALLEKMCEKALEHGFNILAWVLTAFGCPIKGDVPIEKVVEFGKWWKSLGARWIGFGDTTGMCNPRQASYFYEYIKDEGFTPEEIIVHFHDTRGTGIANNVAALQAGMIYFDTSIGAIGGQPATGAPLYHLGYAGNTCTEDLVCMFEEMGVDTGIDIQGLMEVGREAERIVGRQLRSNVIRCGPVQHEPHDYPPQE
ncbi:hydroxymethylglutaryl-CoA lyase [Calderihabitans maritimus]|uniref:Putative hydroxymethylglutaryl-CoA lyase n=1 Tax=Calderihabitans maritimus TaxID=1246530 RepID=A0A1Z5HX50_9FIRM|nr:hydroxymethylglutaryl-CoA lyase [Calderihabitans maritimus]GAW93937.1 putative hydroxymethylglutaryl-CoA lyase [Calderihabitans maritimus]